MYHTQAHPTAIQLVDSNPDLKHFVRELHHKFGAVVMSYDKRSDREFSCIMLTKENGMPFCVVHTQMGNKRDGTNAVEYTISAPFIQKDRGRSGERNTRESINLKSLIKLLEQDVKSNSHESSINKMIPDIMHMIKESAKEHKGVRYNGSIRFHDDVAEELMLNVLEGVALSQKSTDTLTKTYQAHLKHKQGLKEAEEMVDRFYNTDNYLLIQYRHCPAVVVKVNLAKENNATLFKVHPEVKCYSTMEQLAADFPDFAVSIKMYQTKRNISPDSTKTLYEIGGYVPLYEDRYDPDLDFAQYYSNIAAYDGFDKFRAMITPVTKYA